MSSFLNLIAEAFLFQQIKAVIVHVLATTSLVRQMFLQHTRTMMILFLNLHLLTMSQMIVAPLLKQLIDLLNNKI
jgi:hypothetical protein